ncbi:MAG: YtxH domain-containing protein [Firmicutes bacterium]|nr:YtxH domain-containing protein [Bacillota bacterium]MBQ4092283.1 YtxH domain-containing protein [Bacillota bacterium]
MSFPKISFSPAREYVREQIPVISKKEAEARENMMLLGGLAIGLVAGAVIGAGIAALTTPQSGSEARQNIREKTDSAVCGVKDTSAKVADKVKSTADDVMGKIKEKFADDEEVIVEYTIRYDDEDEAAAAACCCCEEEAAEEETYCCEEQKAGTCCCDEAPAEEEKPAE